MDWILCVKVCDVVAWCTEGNSKSHLHYLYIIRSATQYSMYIIRTRQRVNQPYTILFMSILVTLIYRNVLQLGVLRAEYIPRRHKKRGSEAHTCGHQQYGSCYGIFLHIQHYVDRNMSGWCLLILFMLTKQDGRKDGADQRRSGNCGWWLCGRGISTLQEGATDYAPTVGVR